MLYQLDLNPLSILLYTITINVEQYVQYNIVAVMSALWYVTL